MSTQKDYYQKMFSLMDRERGQIPAYDMGIWLVDRLRKDFYGERAIFSGKEYRDPNIREFISTLLSQRRDVVVVPRKVTKFVRAILGSGAILNLYSGFGEFLEEFGGGLGVERVGPVGECARFLLELADVRAEVVTSDPLLWESNSQFERIVCTPPFGMREGESASILKGLHLLETGARLAAVVSPAFLWGSKQSKARGDILQIASVSAVISLPANVFNSSSIPSAILILKKDRSERATYMARSKNLADLETIATDYEEFRQDKKCSLGFQAVLGSERWDVAHHEPVDFGLGGLTFSHRLVPLGDIARISVGKPSDDAKIAVNRTGSKVVWLADEPKLTAKNNLFVASGKDVNPAYLYLYLNSSIGDRALAGLVKGNYVSHVSGKELAKLPVILPELLRQNEIVSDALELKRTIESLQVLAIEGEDTIKGNLFGLATAKQKFDKFSLPTEQARYQQLPFPIAVVQRKIRNAPNNTQRFSLLIELFEVVVRFIVVVHLADYINNRKQAPVLAEHVPEIRKLFAPALGDWVNIFKAFARLNSEAGSTPFLAEVKAFKLDKYQRTLHEFVDIRNASLRGHGATLSEDEYELRFQEHAPKVYELVSSVGFLSNYVLVRTGPMEKSGDFFTIAAQTLMGDNPHFETKHIASRTPFDTNKVLFLNRDQEFVVLDPYVVLELCPECKRPEVLLFDKLSEKKITYLGYESGHRPALETADRLPSIIRELAIRRT